MYVQLRTNEVPLLMCKLKRHLISNPSLLNPPVEPPDERANDTRRENLDQASAFSDRWGQRSERLRRKVKEMDALL